MNKKEGMIILTFSHLIQFFFPLNAVHLFHRWQPSWVRSQPYLCSSSPASSSTSTPFPNTCSGALTFPMSGTFSYFRLLLNLPWLLIFVGFLWSEKSLFKWARVHEVSPFSDTALRGWSSPSTGWTGRSWSAWAAWCVSSKSLRRSCSCWMWRMRSSTWTSWCWAFSSWSSDWLPT